MKKKGNTPTTTIVLTLRRKHPEWPLAKIGSQAGISRQRVHQLLRHASLPTSSRIIQTRKETDVTTVRNTSLQPARAADERHQKVNQKKIMPRFSTIPIEEALVMKKSKAKAKVLEEYKKYVVSLGPREAGRVIVSNDREGQMLRTRIKRSAAALGLNVTVKKVQNEILFWHENGS